MVDYHEEGSMINGAYYAEEVRQLCQEIVKKRRGKLIEGILLVQDNASATPLKLLWLPRLNAALKSFLIPCILQI